MSSFSDYSHTLTDTHILLLLSLPLASFFSLLRLSVLNGTLSLLAFILPSTQRKSLSLIVWNHNESCLISERKRITAATVFIRPTGTLVLAPQ
ncbi:hypothetical protein K457DRAFT_1731468 [Linnemannia elongata AG-77]|uniref:Uncharacterized protein n=1 Tax=Linnemannia elongata AG-77 TaxID=1314771 RepID=A0A197JFJ9_9FUNG|nr:hypothetical protein K457DRAFT_1731468 [Linnemannia elongata AG-77]